MLTIYGRKSSFNVQKVMWLVVELGVAHRHIEVGGKHGGLDTPAFRALTPVGRVPVIEDDGVAVWESHAILRYLAARYGADRFWSEDAATRSSADRWMDWAQTALQPAFLNGIFWGYYRTPAARRDMKAVLRKWDETNAHLGLLDRVLAGRSFLLGEQITLADIPAATNLYRYFNMDLPRPTLPHVERWYASLSARPAYRTHVMIPFEDLFGRLDY